MERMASAREAAWPRHEFTADEIERMAAIGAFDEGPKVELLDGELVDVSPQGPVHSTLHTELADALRAAFGAGLHVRGQCPIRAGVKSLPEPDIAVVRGRVGDYRERHPQGSDVVLVVEVSVSTQVIDRKKARIYAAAGVPVYWLLDVVARTLTVHEQPAAGGYARSSVLSAADEVELPGRAIRWRVGDLL
jgi:Uma2 family endonuclease